MTTIAVAQARMGSTRLPGKVLKDIAGRPAIEWVVGAAYNAPGVDDVIVATSTLPADDVIADWAKSKSVKCFRGSETDVLSRYLGAVDKSEADVIVRLTGDCPFLDPNVIGEVVRLRQMTGTAYATNTDPPTYPDGLDVEVFTREALEIAHREAIRQTDRDTVTRFLVRNRHRFPAANSVCPLPRLDRERWVLDSPEDYEFITKVAERLTDFSAPASYLEILDILEKNPELRAINSKFSRNERFYADLAGEEGVRRSYSMSKIMLDQAEHVIPLGAQTFSKSKLVFPEGNAPLFVTHGDGGYVFDVDGNDYIDLVGGLLPNILGYRDPDVDGAIRHQLSRGISMSLATNLEHDLADRLITHIPSAEMVRFGKNGSDVTSAAVRLARHITGREKVVVGGYHGWHDWSAPNKAGVPQAVQELSFSKAHIGGFVGGSNQKPAAVILEPEFFSTRELQVTRQWCDDHAIILIFDEIISGFRCGLGGLQAQTGVTPDLSTFGKSMANGMPISALVGAERYMKKMPEISFSGTFFGECLSLAAAIATIDKLAAKDVPDTMRSMGLWLQSKIREIIDHHGLKEHIWLHGIPELNRIGFKNNGVQTLFIQEMTKRGILIIGSHNLCYAHGQNEMGRIIHEWNETCEVIAKAVTENLLDHLDGGLVKTGGVRS